MRTADITPGETYYAQENPTSHYNRQEALVRVIATRQPNASYRSRRNDGITFEVVAQKGWTTLERAIWPLRPVQIVRPMSKDEWDEMLRGREEAQRRHREAAERRERQLATLQELGKPYGIEITRMYRSDKLLVSPEDLATLFAAAEGMSIEELGLDLEV